LHALWILDPDAEKTKELEKLLALKPGEAIEPSPGFVLRAQIGTGFNASQRQVTGENTVFSAATRLYFTFVLGKTAGRHQMRWQVLDSTGKNLVDQTWEMEFFKRDFALVGTGVWQTPGAYQAIWSMDGAERKKIKFELR